MSLIAELKGQDRIEIDNDGKIKVIGCFELLNLIKEYKKKYSENIETWPMPKGVTHSELLLKELLLKKTGQWQYPYPHQELCHCRAIETEVVDQSIVNGAHSTDKVSRLTSASTACGTCRSEVEKIIRYRLQNF